MGRSQPVMRCRTDLAARHNQVSSGITGYIPGIFRAYSGHIPGIFQVRNNHRVSYCPSPVMPSPKSRRCGMARRRIACGIAGSRAVLPVAGHGVGDGRRVPYGPLSDRVPYGPSPDHVLSCPSPCRRPHVSAAFTVGRAEGPSSAMPRPNSACRRRRQPLFANIFSLVRRGASVMPVRRRG